jgi:hypothetical protein
MKAMADSFQAILKNPKCQDTIQDGAGEMKTIPNIEKQAKRIRKLALLIYTSERAKFANGEFIGFFYNKLNQLLRNSGGITDLSEAGILSEVRRLLGADELAPFAELLMDALRCLPPASDAAMRLTRGGKMPIAAYEQIEHSVGSVLVFPTFTTRVQRVPRMHACSTRVRRVSLMSASSCLMCDSERFGSLQMALKK